VAALLEAAAQVLERDGPTRLTTNAVAARAGVSIGSFYQYFPNKQALLAALVTRARADLRAGFTLALARTAERDLETGMAALLRVAIRHQTARPALARALDVAERQLAVDAELAGSAETIRAAVLTLLRRHARRLDPAEDLERLAADVVLIAHAMIGAADEPNGLEPRVMRALIGYLRPKARVERRRYRR
jgi:AcrR family transcriptional regulator